MYKFQKIIDKIEIYQKINDCSDLGDSYINKISKFNDVIWDFSYENTENRKNSLYKINFCEFENEEYLKILKIVCFKYLDISQNKVSSAGVLVINLKRVLNKLIKLGAYKPNLINEKIIKTYLEERIHIKTLYKEVGYLKKFLIEVEEYYSISLQNEMNLLEKIMYKKNIVNKSKNGYLPYKYMKNLIEKIELDLEDISIPIDHRIVIGLLGIAIYTGMRCEELSLLERGKLEEIVIKNKKIYYLKFKTFKTVEKTIAYRNTTCHIEEEGAKIYIKVEELGDALIEGFSKITLDKAYYYYYTGEYVKNKKKLPKEKRDIVDELTLETKNELRNKMKKYLWMNRYGMISKGSTSLAASIRKYFANNYEYFGVDYLTELEKRQVKSFTIKNKSTYERLMDVNTRKKLSFEEAKKRPFYYVNVHQLRSTLCTNLYKQNVPLDYIMKHLNHLSEDMTAYYNRTDLFADEFLECLDILKDFTNNEGLINEKIELSKDNEILEDLKKINKFLDENKLNINSDLEKIKKVLKLSNSDIAVNEFGVCIKNIVSGICEKRKYFSQYYSKLYYGVNLDNYKFLDIHYERFKEQISIFTHNLDVKCSEVEISRQRNCIKSYLTEVLLKEIELLEKDLMLKGKEKVLLESASLKHIVDNLDELKMGVIKWIK